MLLVPRIHKRNVDAPSHATRTLVERIRRPKQRNAVGGVLGEQRLIGEDRLDILGELKVNVLVVFLMESKKYMCDFVTS